MIRQLYFGDNLDILREHIKDESVDLIYLDPPFNSKRDYNLLFKSPKGHESDAQITAFEDSWHWGAEAEKEFAEILHHPNTEVAEMMQALRRFLGENDMMAYLVMMCNRLLELHRVLKPTGSLYLHCDPTASHYLKIVLDGVFGKENYRNEIIWKRNTPHANTLKKFPVSVDSIFYYVKNAVAKWQPVYADYRDGYVDKYYSMEDTDGRLFQPTSLLGHQGVNPEYEWRGFVKPWRYPKHRLDELDAVGIIYWPGKGGIPRLKRYLDDQKGMPIEALWTDIPPINSQAAERLGYPTQKPLALLERIINASSNEGDVILDPFCGCGTAVHASEKLNRQWIGIDITHLAVSLIEKRMKDAFPGIKIEVHGTPTDLDGARDLAQRDKYQFQWWACSLVNAQPYQGKKKGADSGIDGLIFFQDDPGYPKKIVVSVKGGDNVSVAMVRDLAHVVVREKAEIGLFVTLATPTDPMKKEAVKEGFYNSPVVNADFPKVQILTIKGLLEGTEHARYPDLAKGGHTFKKAKVEKKSINQGELF